MNNICSIIPARGSSKTLPYKNIRTIAGEPLIAWTIEAALQAKRLQRVIVSTDDEKIVEVALACGAEVPFLRPASLAEDETPTLPVLQHALQWLATNQQYLPDAVVTLQPTSPLRRAEHIDQAVSLLEETNADSVVSVCLVEHSPYWMMRLDGNRGVPFTPELTRYTRRQDLPPIYRLNGAVYVTRRDLLMIENRVQGEDLRAIVMDAESSVDIDTLLDLKVAELILREREYASS